jgi:hypothetical protein
MVPARSAMAWERRRSRMPAARRSVVVRRTPTARATAACLGQLGRAALLALLAGLGKTHTPGDALALPGRVPRGSTRTSAVVETAVPEKWRRTPASAGWRERKVRRRRWKSKGGRETGVALWALVIVCTRKWRWQTCAVEGRWRRRQTSTRELRAFPLVVRAEPRRRGSVAIASVLGIRGRRWCWRRSGDRWGRGRWCADIDSEAYRLACGQLLASLRELVVGTEGNFVTLLVEIGYRYGWDGALAQRRDPSSQVRPPRASGEGRNPSGTCRREQELEAMRRVNGRHRSVCKLCAWLNERGSETRDVAAAMGLTASRRRKLFGRMRRVLLNRE